MERKIKIILKLILIFVALIFIFNTCSKILQITPKKTRPKNCKIYINKRTGKGTCNPIGYEEDQSDLGYKDQSDIV